MPAERRLSSVDRRAIAFGVGFVALTLVIGLAAASTNGLTVGAVLVIVTISVVSGTLAALAWRQQQNRPDS